MNYVNETIVWFCSVCATRRECGRTWLTLRSMHQPMVLNWTQKSKPRLWSTASPSPTRYRQVYYFHVSSSFCVKISRFAFCYPFDDERAGWKKKSEIRWLCVFCFASSFLWRLERVARWPAAHCGFLPVVATLQPEQNFLLSAQFVSVHSATCFTRPAHGSAQKCLCNTDACAQLTALR